METKIIKPINVLFYSEITNLGGIAKLVRVKANELHKEAIMKKMEITGPVYWIYYGMDGNPQTNFTLEIAVPVLCQNHYEGNFLLKELPEFKCASMIHYGSWYEMPGSYSQLMGEVFKNDLTFSGVSREVYLNIDFLDMERNITEIQVGLD
jgi:effector-binding domain-containing protein